MKPVHIANDCRISVAPHTGAWIETEMALMWLMTFLVAPHTGAWIETGRVPMALISMRVAPHTGAWIETKATDFVIVLAVSHPTRVRGLKPP